MHLTCSLGFALNGSNLLQCDETGHWTDPFPSCIPISCQSLPSPAHGTVFPSNISEIPYNDHLTYSCDPGYYLDGLERLTCRGMDEWTGSLPQCLPVNCGHPGWVNDGQLIGSDFTLESIVKFTCNDGYTLRGEPSITCLSNGLWSSSAPHCQPITCSPPVHIENGSTTYSTLSFNSKVRYQCDAGYILQGEPVSICGSNASWIPPPPICSPVECPLPEPIENGQISINGRAYLQVVQFSCDSGYRLEGASQLSCLETAEWSQPIPSCVKIRCMKPEDPLNGRASLNGSEASLGDSVEYSCDYGYVLVGTHKRICSEDSSWSDEQPECHVLTCPEPVPLEHGNYIKKASLSVGAVVHYTCENGYESKGKGSRTCRADGTWTGPTPKCTPIHCTLPNSIKYGKFMLDDMNYGSTVQYQCDQGYEIEGPASRKCTNFKTWSGDEPSCQQVACTLPDEIPHGTVHVGKSGTAVGSILTYKCDPGYHLVGNSERVCGVNQTWMGSEPQCIIRHCPPPSPSIPHGSISGDNFTFSSIIYYDCHMGYVRDGPSQRRCREDGLWDGSEPKCHPVRCPIPAIPDHGSIWGYDFHYGDVVTYACNRGYKLVGPSERTCLANQTWDDTDPSCLLIHCGHPGTIANGNVTVLSDFHEGKAVYQCNLHYTLEGNHQRICNSDGEWTGVAPECVGSQCESPPNITHGESLMNGGIMVGAIVQYQCDPGYKIVPSNWTLTCQPGGLFEGEPPTCIQITCNETNLFIANGQAAVNGTGLGDVASFSCDIGYVLVGPAERTCVEDGYWSGVEPLCEAVSCPDPPSVRNANYTLQDQYFYGDVIDYQCDDFFDLVSDTNSLTCADNASWVGQMPECVAISCPVPNIENGHFHLTNTSHMHSALLIGAVISFECLEGYFLDGLEELVCLPNGSWSDISPNCIPSMCFIPDIPHGNSSQTSIASYQDRISVTCDPGFQLFGPSVLQCGMNNTWHPEISVCIPVSCSPPVLQDGDVYILETPLHGFGYPLGIKIGFECHAGFELRGEESLTCQVNRTWSSDYPLCEPVKCEPSYFEAALNVIVLNPQDEYDIGDVIEFTCTEGHEFIHGEDTQRNFCTDEGTWNGTNPDCVEIICRPPNILHASVLEDADLNVTYFFGSQIIIECDEGFLLEGSDESLCARNGTWLPDLPHCEPIRCSPLSFAGLVTSPNDTSGDFIFGDEVVFSCPEGFRPHGHSHSKCQSDGSWSHNSPVCRPVSCSNVSIRGGFVVHLDIIRSFDYEYLYQDEIHIKCLPGYELSNTEMRPIVCGADGEWSGVIPSCNPIRCPQPNMDNAVITVIGNQMNPEVEEYVYGDLITIRCLPGYDINGTTDNLCLDDKTWLEPLPSCVIKHCLPLDISNAVLNTSERTFGTHLGVTCQEGYELFGDEALRCGPEGLWEGEPPECHIINCPSPKIRDGKILSTSAVPGAFTFGETVTFRCRDGYKLEGPSQLSCLPNRTWSGSFPVCTKGICPPLNTSVPHAKSTVLYSDHYHILNLGTIIQYECLIGYELVNGSSSVVCGTKEEWEGKLPVCEEIHCPAPEDAPFRYFSLQSAPSNRTYFTFGDTLSFECEEGFQLDGEGEIFCQPNKEWSSPPPLCVPVTCHPPNITSGKFTGDNLTYNESIRLDCYTGFELHGPSVATCLSNRTWSTLGRCLRVECPFPEILPNGICSASGSAYEDVVHCECSAGYQLHGRKKRQCKANQTWSGKAPRCQKISCGNLPFIPHADLLGEGHFFGDNVTIDCHEGFFFNNGSATVICQADGSWSQVEGACQPVECPHPLPLEHGFIIGTRHVFNASIHFHCEEGFELIGSHVITCQANGDWSEGNPVCQRKTCPNPPMIDVGFFVAYNKVLPSYNTSEGFSFQMTVEYFCDIGYEMHGSSVLMCTANGTWSGDGPTCLKVQCPPLPVLPNAFPEKTSIQSYHYQDIVNYQCIEGYDTADSLHLTCSANRTWILDGTGCRKVQCSPDELDLDNGFSLGSDFFYQSVFTYTCQRGYKMIGKSVRTCLSNGTWSGTKPTCEIITCPRPNRVEHGWVQKTRYEYNTTVSYFCDDGYDLIGPHLRLCLHNGSWSGADPWCKIVQCPPPPELQNATHTGSSPWEYSTTVDYTCDRGFSMVGRSSIECLSNRHWTSLTGRCTRLECGIPQSPENGTVKFSSLWVDAIAYYECDVGLELIGSQYTICLENQHWSNVLPICLPIECPVPADIPNGHVSATEVYFGSVATYSCNHHYELVGNDISHCTANGTWSSEPPTCRMKQCPLPPPIDNGVVNGDSRVPSAIISYLCDRGYRLVGSNHNMCTPEEQWQNPFPSCERVDCGPPDSLKDGAFDDGDTTYGSVRTAYCSPGFALDGVASIECLRNGTWTPFKGECLPVTCKSPPVIPNASIQGNKYTYGKTIVYICHEGYEHERNHVLKCGEDGEWKGEVPQCELVNCGAENLPVIPFASNVVFHTTYSSVVHYECNAGYTLQGGSSVTCTANGTWVYDEMPRCEPVSCGLPPHLPQGRVTLSGLTYGHNATYRCNEGYSLLGSRTLWCKADGEWSGFVPLCQPIKCPLPLPVDHGTVHGPGNGYGMIISYSCETGYQLIGHDKRKCLQNASWSGQPPRCECEYCIQCLCTFRGYLVISLFVNSSNQMYSPSRP